MWNMYDPNAISATGENIFGASEYLSREEVEAIKQTVSNLLETNITDIHLTEQKNIWIRERGRMKELKVKLPQGGLEDIRSGVLGAPSWDRANCSMTYVGKNRTLRLRLRFSQTMSRNQLFIRLLPNRAPTLEELGYTGIFDELAGNTKPGLVLVAGATGSGKSTLLASLLQRYLDTQPIHICTVEDPVEYVLYDGAGESSQREMPDDTPTFGTAIKDVLREDPDIILAGEMRDAETAVTALTAAETGHMVFSTVHASNIAGIASRMLGLLSGVPDIDVRFAQAFLGGIHLDVVAQSDGTLTRKMRKVFTNDDVRRFIEEQKYSGLDAFAFEMERAV